MFITLASTLLVYILYDVLFKWSDITSEQSVSYWTFARNGQKMSDHNLMRSTYFRKHKGWLSR